MSSGKLSPNTKAILNVFQTGIPVISCARAGRFPTEALQTSRLNARRPHQSNISSGTSSAPGVNDWNSIARR